MTDEIKSPHAFPIPEGRWHDGMLLRDYFACAVVQGIVSIPGNTVNRTGYDKIAYDAYLIADAMLKERNTKR